MKIDWNKRYTTISVYSFLVVCASVSFFAIVSKFSVVMGNLNEIISVLNPFIIGFAIAYLLNFILKFYEEKVFKFKIFSNLKRKRALGMILTYVSALVLLGLFIQFVLPQLIASITGLINDIPGYIREAETLMNEIIQKLNIGEEYVQLAADKWNELSNNILEISASLAPVLIGVIGDIASSVWNIVIGTIISVYLLIDKERFYALSKKMTYGLFTEKRAKRILEITHRSNDTFGRFLSGKILDSTIIGILTFVVLTIFKMPYVLLISVIIGVTNIIPFFGPFIGAIPATIIIMFVNPVQGLWFILIILVIQQLDGNIIGPKILGDSIGISAIWILFSILVAGKFMGFVGMIIGVPAFAVIYSIIKEIVEERLEKKDLPSDTEEYM